MAGGRLGSPGGSVANPAEGGEQFDLMVEVNPVKDYWGGKIPRPKPNDAKANEVLFSEADLVVVNKPVRAFRRAASLLFELATTLIERNQAVRTMDQLTEQFYYELAPTVPESPYRAEHIFQRLDAALDRLDLQAVGEELAEQASEALVTAGARSQGARRAQSIRRECAAQFAFGRGMDVDS